MMPAVRRPRGILRRAASNPPATKAHIATGCTVSLRCYLPADQRGPEATGGYGLGREWLARQWHARGQGFKSPQLHQAQHITHLRSERRLPEICQKRCLALPHTALCRLRLPWPLSCDDVVRRGVPHGYARWPRSLHTAEATGSKPVTPTTTNSPLNPRIHPRCQQIVSKSRYVAAVRRGITLLGEGLEHAAAGAVQLEDPSAT
jgi:hypothetical protein